MALVPRHKVYPDTRTDIIINPYSVLSSPAEYSHTIIVRLGRSQANGESIVFECDTHPCSEKGGVTCHQRASLWREWECEDVGRSCFGFGGDRGLFNGGGETREYEPTGGCSK